QLRVCITLVLFFFFFRATATLVFYTLSLHDALPILFLMSSLMLLLVWLIFFMVLIKLLPILGTISGKTVKLMVLALICLGKECRSEERFSRNAETDLVCRLLLEKKNWSVELWRRTLR